MRRGDNFARAVTRFVVIHFTSPKALISLRKPEFDLNLNDNEDHMEDWIKADFFEVVPILQFCFGNKKLIKLIT